MTSAWDCDCTICAPTVARLNSPALPPPHAVEARDARSATPVVGRALKSRGRTIRFGPEQAILVIEGVVFVAPLSPVPAQREAASA